MLLFKCSCGCFFTASESSFGDGKWVKCQNCGASIRMHRNVELCELDSELEKAKITVHSIPDNAKITVTFDA